jgi:acyl-CoA dehydrogenase
MTNVTTQSSWMDEDLQLFRDSLRRHIADDLAPHAEQWRAQKMVSREAWKSLGAIGALCPSVPEAYGGVGGSFAYEAMVIEALERGVSEMSVGFSVHSAIVAHYLVAYGSEEQKKRWLPGMVSGEIIGAIAMTEPGAGSDVQSIRTTALKQGNVYKLNGQKTFITNGQLAGLILVAAKTDPKQGAKGTSLFLVDGSSPGYRRGRNLDKIGLQASDTSELFFDDVELPPDALLGAEEGKGFAQMMQQLPQERLALAIGGIAAMERAVEITIEYCKDRQAFGKPILEFQNTSFKLAELVTECRVGRAFVDDCIARHVAGTLDGATASMAKMWISQKQNEVVDSCLQLHGGYGYMREYEIARRFVDARIQKIYGGTNEIMKLLIARTL